MKKENIATKASAILKARKKEWRDTFKSCHGNAKKVKEKAKEYGKRYGSTPAKRWACALSDAKKGSASKPNSKAKTVKTAKKKKDITISFKNYYSVVAINNKKHLNIELKGIVFTDYFYKRYDQNGGFDCNGKPWEVLENKEVSPESISESAIRGHIKICKMQYRQAHPAGTTDVKIPHIKDIWIEEWFRGINDAYLFVKKLKEEAKKANLKTDLKVYLIQQTSDMMKRFDRE